MLSKQTRSPARRAAFTLIEILVVMFIIAMLSGFTFCLFSSATDFTNHLQQQVAAHQAPVKVARFDNTDRSQRLGDRYIVVFKDSVTDPKAEVVRICAGETLEVACVYRNVLNGVAVKTTSSAVAALQKDPAVRYVTQEKICYACAQVIPTGVRRIGTGFKGAGNFGGTSNDPAISPLVRNLGTSQAVLSNPFAGGVAVAVLDSGVNARNPDLNVVVAKSFNAGSTNSASGHGNKVAGIIGAKNNDLGLLGVAPGVRIWNYKILDQNNKGNTVDVIAGIDDLATVANQVGVACIALTTDFDQALNDAVDRLVDRGVVVVVAAGNSTADVKDYSPASAPKAICVASFSDSDGRAGGKGPDLVNGDPDDTFTSDSNFGPGVHLVAPGVDLLVFGSGQSLVFDSGTSLAAAHVAGVVALILGNKQPTSTTLPSTLPPPRLGNLGLIGGQPLASDFNSPVPILTPDLIRQLLIQNASGFIKGLSGNSDTRKYPVVNARKL